MRQLTSSKPLSSPGRAASDKFPPPLMRFLRSNVGSRSTRSRSRSRSRPRSRPRSRTPMFFRRKKSSAIVEATQEPSSPKVTCIGQVRVRRSINRRSKNNNNNNSTSMQRKAACKCGCGYGCGKCKCMSFSLCGLTSCLRRGLRKCGWFWGCSSSVSHKRNGKDSTSEDTNSVQQQQQQLNAVTSRNMETREAYYNRYQMYAAFPRTVKSSGEKNLDNDDQDEGNVEVVAPPKNAFLLTRCRSAPYRSSSLACRFWGSPLHGDERESSGDSTTGGSEPEEGERGSRDSAVKTRVDDSEEVSAQHKEKEKEQEEQEEEEEDDVVGKCEGQKGNKRDSQVEEERRPLMLMRCKSEPAARSGCEGELDPLTSSFWKNRRLSNTETSCTTTKANPVN